MQSKTERRLFMQILKEDIKHRILDVARQEFASRGYAKASMRSIASKVGVGVGNIYNYYPSKDKLFCAVLAPVVSACYAMFDKHHGEYGQDAISMTQENYLVSVVSDYMIILKGNRTLLKILLFKAQGSSLEDFKIKFTDKATEQVKSWFADNKKKHPYMNIDVSDFMIHLHTVWMFTMFEEIIMHRITGDAMVRVIEEYIKFEINGWKNILHIG